MNRTAKSGSTFFTTLALCLSMFLVGSCNESAVFFDFTKKRVALESLSKSELLRYGYAVQAALIQKPDNLTKFRAADIKLALATPNLERKEGARRIWQYRGTACVVDIFWQREGVQRYADHMEMRPRRSVLSGKRVKSIAPWQCMQQIVQERRASIEKNAEESYAVLSLNAHKS